MVLSVIIIRSFAVYSGLDTCPRIYLVSSLLLVPEAESGYFEAGIQKTFLVIFTSVLFQRGRWQYELFLTNFSAHVFFHTPSVNGHAYFIYV